MNSVKPWLDQAGKFPVEPIPCPHFSQPVDLDAPRTGVLHTTEGPTVEGALAIFRQHYAPHFLVGLDAHRQVRVLQLVQVGTIGAALVTHNWLAIVQVEMVGFSKETLWRPDDGTAEALASLMAVCKREYGIPLAHPWADGDFGRAGDNPHRHAGKFGVAAGWYAHGDCPSPDTHWDVGALEWSSLLDRASAMTDILNAPAWAPPPPPPRPCAGGQQPPSPAPGSLDLSTVAGFQAALVALGYSLEVDGIDGLETAAAIKAFQQRAGLPVDGDVGEATRAAMAKELSPMLVLETLASLPQVKSLRVADEIMRELSARGLVIVPALQVGPAASVTVRPPDAPPQANLLAAITPRAAIASDRALHPVDYLDI